jgi:hypothetical protein
MINWMVEVTHNFKCSDHTFFLAVTLMDRYCKNTVNTILTLEGDLHIMGVTCLFIASKFEDKNPLTLYQIVKGISHGKFTREEIKAYEIRILKCISYKVGSCPSLWHFLEIELQDKEDHIQHLICLFLAKLTCHDYHFTSIKPSILA